MPKYDFQYFHDQLILLQSTNYLQYKDTSEFDILIEKISTEEIYDFNTIKWTSFANKFVDIEERPSGIDPFSCCYVIVKNDTLARIIHSISSREVRIKLLRYLQINPTEIYEDYINTDYIEKECARLLSEQIQESARDEFHGDYASMPRPNYVQYIQQSDIFSRKTPITEWIIIVPNF